MNEQIKRFLRKTDEKLHSITSRERKNRDELSKRAYEATLFSQKHAYSKWIALNEKPASKAGKEISGEWIMLHSEKGAASEHLTGWLSEYVRSEASAQIIYGDEDYIWESGAESVRFCPFFKPDYSPETLLSFFYMGELLIVKRAFFSSIFPDIKIDKKTKGAGKGKIPELVFPEIKLYEMALIMAEHAGEGEVCHLPKVIWHRFAKELIGSSAGDADTAEKLLIKALESDENIERVLPGCGRAGEEIRLAAAKRFAGSVSEDITCKIDDKGVCHLLRSCNVTDEKGSRPARVSVVILSKDNPTLLEKCIKSLRDITEYPDYEVIVVDNGSNAQNKTKCEKLAWNLKFTYFYQPMEFNFSALCNFGVKKSSGELVLLMNDDVEVCSADFMRLMAGMALSKGIGAVGAKLLYGDGSSLQHVGVTSLEIGPSHQLQRKSDGANLYFGRNRVNYNMLGVTAACLMIKRSAWDEVGGLDESLRVAYNDVDFCMKLHERGYRNIQCNGAALIHHESLTRGYDGDNAEKWDRLLNEKERLYIKHPQFKGYDPYHNINLIGNSSEYVCDIKNPFQDYNALSRIRPITLPAKNDFKIRLHMDHGEIQRRFEKNDKDCLWIDGWAYVSGADQSCYFRKLLLIRSDGSACYEVDSRDVYRPDVSQLLPAVKNNELLGFFARIPLSDIPAGEYNFGILYKVGGTKKQAYCTAELSCRFV